MKVAVGGLGYVGVPGGGGGDTAPGKVEATNAGRTPLRGREPGLPGLLKDQVRAGRLHATTDPSAIGRADVGVVCVETPIDPATHDPGYRALKTALAHAGPHLKRGALVSIESTLAPGTMQRVGRAPLERSSRRK